MKCFWVNLRKKTRCLNPTWQNVRWLASSSWVRINEFESDWISLSQSQSGERVFLSESQKKNKVSESKMAEFKMAGIIKLRWEWMSEVVFVQMEGTNLGKCQWDWEGKLRWLKADWQNSRWLPSPSWVRINEISLICQYGGKQSWQVWVSLSGKLRWLNPRWPN